MNIAPGLKLGSYEIISLLGKGGMGEVWRAQDTRLDRAVAIKVLPASLASDPDRLSRFALEAKATSALNHPNILTVHDIGTHENAPYIVAELLEGEELRAQLDKGALPVRKAIEYAQQIAAGLAVAHEKNIVHRDLKPENLFVTKDGRVKILDFGLAKLTGTRKAERRAQNEEATESQKSEGGTRNEEEVKTLLQDDPNIHRSAFRAHPSTLPGTVMGTVAYMSPEQVRGQDLEQRSDLFSFGLILYEMLAGQRAFQKESFAETMSAIANEEPRDLSELNPKVTPQLEKIVRHCLEKKPELRFQSARDLGFALEALSTPYSSGANRTEAVQALETSATTKRGGWRERIAWIVAGLTTLGMLAFGVAYVRRPALEAEPMRLFITPPEKATSFDWPVISPDGRTLAFIAAEDGKRQLWVRPLNSTTATSLGEADHPVNGAAPFWSPDSQFLAFQSEGKLKKIALTGGAAEPLCDLSIFRGGTWNQAGVILFADSSDEIKRVSANGGTVTNIIKPDPAQGQIRMQAPVFLPDGRHFVYYISHTDLAKNGVYLGLLDSGESRQVVSCDSVTIGVASDLSAAGEGRLMYVRQGALLAQAFNFRQNQAAGDPVRIAASVATNNYGWAKFSLAHNGTLVLLDGRRNSQFTWFDRTGKRLETVGQPGRWLASRLSPDEQRLVAERMEAQSFNADLRLLDLARGTDTRFTFDPLHDQRPIWSPDGSRIVWGSNREGLPNLYQKAASGAGQDELLLRSTYQKSALDWSADGRFILYQESTPQTNNDLWVLPLAGGGKPWPWLTTPFMESNGQFSPDGKWIAYSSNESGRDEIYVQAFVPDAPASGGKWQLSTGGGVNPIWRRAGRELYFTSPGLSLMVVEVTLGADVKAGAPRELFSFRGLRSSTTGSLNVSGDGQRFLFAADETTSLPPFTVVLNWMAEGKK